jgi:hypothetical protein
MKMTSIEIQAVRKKKQELERILRKLKVVPR